MSYLCTKPLEYWLTSCFLFNHAFRAKLRRANVHFLSKPVKDGTTGTVIVLTTPDAQRTMLAYQVSSLLPLLTTLLLLNLLDIILVTFACYAFSALFTLFRYLRVPTCVWTLSSSLSGLLRVYIISKPYAYQCVKDEVKFPFIFYFFFVMVLFVLVY
jgi:hypothetical protein